MRHDLITRSFVVSTSWVSQVDTLKKNVAILWKMKSNLIIPGCTIQCFLSRCRFYRVNIEGGKLVLVPRWPVQNPPTTVVAHLARLFIWKKLVKDPGKLTYPIGIHGAGIFTYIWLIFLVHVGKYNIHGWYGYPISFSKRALLKIIFLFPKVGYVSFPAGDPLLI